MRSLEEPNSIVDLSLVLLEKCYIEKSMSESLRKRITEPIGEMDMPDKIERAKVVLDILKECETEQEILERVAALDK